jgi:hypothetical protein
VRDGGDSGVAMMAAAKMAAAEDSGGGRQQQWLTASMRAAAADDGVDGSRRGEALNGGDGSDGSMMAAQRRQCRRLKGNKGGGDDTMRAVGETAADDGVGGGRWGRGMGGGGMRSVCFVFYLLLYILSRQSTQKSGNFPGDFQQTSRNPTANYYRTRSRVGESWGVELNVALDKTQLNKLVPG